MGWEGEDVLWTHKWFLWGFCMVLLSENYSRPTRSPVCACPLPPQPSCVHRDLCLGVGSSCWQSHRHPNSTTLGWGPVSPRSCEAVAKVLSAGRQWVSGERTGIKTPVPAS